MWQSNIPQIKKNIEDFKTIVSGKAEHVAQHKKKIQDLPEDFKRHLYHTACAYHHQGQFSKAQSVFSFLCCGHSDKVFLWQSLGLSLYMGNKIKHAASVFSIAEKLDAQDSRTLYFLGLCFLKCGEIARAKKKLHLAIKHSKKDAIYSALANKSKRILTILDQKE